MSDSENKSAQPQQPPPPESLPWWDGETELTPENVQSFRYEHDMYWEREPHYFNVLSRDPNEYAFRYDHDTGVLVEVLAKGNSGLMTQNLRLAVRRHLHQWYGIDAQYFCVLPGCKQGSAAAAQGSAAAAQGSAGQQTTHDLQTDGGLHPSHPLSHKQSKQAGYWAPTIVFEAEWLGVNTRASVGEKIIRTKTGHLRISPDRFNGVQGRGKVKEYLDNTDTQVVFLASPDVGCVYVFVKRGYAAYASNVQVANQDGEVKWAKGHRCYVQDKAGLPNPLFAWDTASKDEKSFVLYVQDPNKNNEIVKVTIMRSEINDGVMLFQGDVSCAICSTEVPAPAWSQHVREHLRSVEDVDAVLNHGVHWYDSTDDREMYRHFSAAIAALPAADGVKDKLRARLDQSYEQYQKHAMDGVGNKRKLSKVDGKEVKQMQRRFFGERKRRIEAEKGRIEAQRGRIEAEKALIARTNDNIASKQLMLTFMPGNHPQRPQTQQDVTKLREELKQLEQQLASEQAELQRLERELRQAQSDSPNNTSSTGPPNNTSSKD